MSGIIPGEWFGFERIDGLTHEPPAMTGYLLIAGSLGNLLFGLGLSDEDCATVEAALVPVSV